MSPAIVAQVECLLGGRTRDIRLHGELAQLFRERSWPRTAKIIRAWMVWVIVLDILTLGLNAILLPAETVTSMLWPASILPPAALVAVLAFRRPHPLWLQGVFVLSAVFLILLSVALVGVNSGGEFYERHLTIMLFVAVTAIIIFPIPLGWAMAIGASALGLYLVFQLRNPGIEAGSALAGTLFFASGVAATVVARRTTTIFAQKTFLLELRDRSRLAELTDANSQLELLARTDPLTGVANRRSMMETLHHFWNEELKHTSGAAMLMCDLDDFKHLNDNLGHAEGDRCLVKVAGIIQSSMRDERDEVARYGGEEFLVFLPGSNGQEARAVAERIRSRVEAASLPNPTSRVVPWVTVSIGIAILQNGDVVSAEHMQRQADAALYLAKKTGRNCVVVHASEVGQTSN
ncbi:diguanylate cyclase (GGDEF)-like protein [Rhizobium leguminosarum]|uniref:diguanylate cyclase n=1 Tax=Rhizobium leguminosarum TaxID=384 RepID=A0AAE2T016_RHILE|nr:MULTISPECIES: diguanylate cyclase [Rhizobium]MBB4293143.1 diguanylate cyclase (GGDEF)-like protein [Rhizobium leguminosarum]MBB4300034.1 diguanylate cyclase (GGDEF)-like protein [Rhizobium leguminosarum]MBB4311160.1 diguanylate cyclase (GGDEF)-like protein [Rhizobium leguminosarum]MBB4435387.1 diguanylate cyclase (GGDEF)-like protein [Rhizobium esperanzae]MBB4532319.1 diguanylate cyclase (GGDEF)-like protein [Rhizobium leguminosarum]